MSIAAAMLALLACPAFARVAYSSARDVTSAGARLFIAFLGIAALSLSSGVAGWWILRDVSSAQSRITEEALPAVAAAQEALREDPAVTDLPGPPDNITAFIENGDNGILPTYFPGECGSLYAGQINSEILTAMEASITKTMSVADAFTAANDNINACLGG